MKLFQSFKTFKPFQSFSDGSGKVDMLYIFALAITLLASFQLSLAAESGKYPPPRFPSYVRPPKNIEDVMPFARAAVRQTGGRTPLGLGGKGQTGAIFTEPMAGE